ncbi:hypothetical protein ACHAXT_013335 [Thalassiosira profunda]
MNARERRKAMEDWRDRRGADYSSKLLDWSGIHKPIDWSTALSTTTNPDGDDDGSTAEWAAKPRHGAYNDFSGACEHFEDEADRNAFVGFSASRYRAEILPLRSEESECSVWLSPKMYPAKALDRFGFLFSHAVHLRSVCFRTEHDQERGYQGMISYLFRGPFKKHSLRTFSFYGTLRRLALSEENMSRIGKYLGCSTSLRYFKLVSITLNGDVPKLFANALEGFALKTLILYDVTVAEDDLSTLLASLDASELRHLSLINCNIGRVVCGALADMLGDEDSALETLCLGNDPHDEYQDEIPPCNRVDDECIALLCGSLSDNTSLTHLSLYDNDLITNQGWECFVRLMYDTRSLDAIARSNNTLLSINGNPLDAELRFGEEPLTHILLRINMREHPYNFDENLDDDLAFRRRLKIAMYLTEGNVFNTSPFDDIDDPRLMPHVLAFLGERREAKLREFDGAYFTVDALYAVLKSWDMPTLYTFPSRERTQLTEELNAAKQEIDKLRRINEELTSENGRLRAENDSLRDDSRHRTKRAKGLDDR